MKFLLYEMTPPNTHTHTHTYEYRPPPLLVISKCLCIPYTPPPMNTGLWDICSQLDLLINNFPCEQMLWNFPSTEVADWYIFMEGRGYGVTPLMLCRIFKLDCFNGWRDETYSEASLSLWCKNKISTKLLVLKNDHQAIVWYNLLLKQWAYEVFLSAHVGFLNMFFSSLEYVM